MVFDYLILISSALLGGSAAFLLPKSDNRWYQLSLIFSGAYLFGITIIHILPELFRSEMNASLTGIFILAGFFLQMVLENFSSGVEHGHLHPHRHTGMSKGLLIVFGLSAHAFLEGTLLSHPIILEQPESQHSHTLLWGIALHKGPAAFALMSVLLGKRENIRRSVLLLLLFVLASPAGLWLGNFLQEFQQISSKSFIILFALVSGSFLHISTTIVFESNESHKLNWRKWLVGILGAGVAVLAEFI